MADKTRIIDGLNQLYAEVQPAVYAPVVVLGGPDVDGPPTGGVIYLLQEILEALQSGGGGGGGSGQAVLFIKDNAEEIWEIEHGLGFMPNVTAFDNDMPPNEIEGTVVHDSVNKVTITYSVPVSGKAVLS